MESSTSAPTATASLLPSMLADPDPVPAHHAKPVVAFIIGVAIVTLASVLNAAGLNLTKLDHVRTSAIPKAHRRRDWLRPLWLLGMLLYILSQLIGSTLALEYLRAEYVAPLGSTSLIFNFLFARFLVGTPVTNTDIYGTIIVILGVIGIVAFGSINSGLETDTSIDRLSYLWGRSGWLGFFVLMSLALALLYTFTSSLDAVLAARSDLSAEPFAGMSARRGAIPANTGWVGKARWNTQRLGIWIGEKLERWTETKDDKQVAWTLGIGWACCGGGLAGGCLVFAKAGVALISGSVSHENSGNQFGHPAAVFTFLFLAVTAVAQIICLNRGLKAYDSTLVVPVFYGVYTATGFLNSLIFNDSVDAYKTWTLFLIFVFILVLISGVVLLTHKKPEGADAPETKLGALPARKARAKNALASGSAPPKGDDKDARDDDSEDEDESEGRALRAREEGAHDAADFELGDLSESEDEDGVPHKKAPAPAPAENYAAAGHRGDEVAGLMAHDGDDGDEPPTATSSSGRVRDATKDGRSPERGSSESDKTLARDEDAEEFGEWKGS